MKPMIMHEPRVQIKITRERIRIPVGGRVVLGTVVVAVKHSKESIAFFGFNQVMKLTIKYLSNKL